MRYIFSFLGIIFGVLGLVASIKDITTPDQPWYVIGQLWFEWAPSSLQVSEAIISRYIDPCGLITALDCSPFLWHPFIATILGWPAALVMIGFSIIFWWVGGLFGRHLTRPKKAARALKRQGEK